jgi:hypothetical protein
MFRRNLHKKSIYRTQWEKNNPKGIAYLTSKIQNPTWYYPLIAAFLVALLGHSAIEQNANKRTNMTFASTQPLEKSNKATAMKVVATENNLDEKKALDAVWKLPQVRRKAREIERLSRGTIRVAAAVDSSPTEDAPYYVVKVFENHPDKSTHTIYWFRVLNPSGVILALDIVQNQYISLEQWKPDAR